jgi:hypothetical protein
MHAIIPSLVKADLGIISDGTDTVRRYWLAATAYQLVCWH